MTDVTAVDIVTAAVAVAAFVLSIVNFRLTGSNVKVQLQKNMSMLTAENDPPAGPFVAITAYNVGRTAVAVSTVGVVAVKRPWGRKGRVLMAHPTSTGPVMPHPLEPGHSATWMLDQTKLIEGKKERERFRGYAVLATKKTKYTLKTLELP